MIYQATAKVLETAFRLAFEEVIKKILKHLGLWDVKLRAPPKVTAPFVGIHQDYSDSQLPPSEDYLYSDPDYPIEVYAS